MIELLLPAGDWDTLRAAVENGADAVYLGVDRFNARRRASNFQLSEIGKVVDYCHSAGVRVYITMNILVKNSELVDFFETIKKLYLGGVDAVIIQQLSFVSLIKKKFPGLEVHISTQAAISNTGFLDLIKKADKIILPREYSKEEINDFIVKTKLATEIFVQGALCFSYSGKCLFSSFLGGRSGNRGLCAQPCRKKYNKSYLLSMKDLSLIKEIPEIIKMGVSTVKIEGRLRSVKYIKYAARVYRQAIDSHYAGKFKINEKDYKQMKLAFNRKFTWGYYSGAKNLVSSDRPMGRGLFLGEMEVGGLIKLEEDLSVGDGVGIWLPKKVDGAVIKKIELDGVIVDKALKGDKVKLFIRAKPGVKIYKTSTKEEEDFVFKKKKAIKIVGRKVKELVLPEFESKKGSFELLVKVYSKADGLKALKYTRKVFYNIFAKDFSNKFCAYIPKLLNDEEVEKAVKLVEKFGVKNVLIGDLGVYSKLKGKNLYIDYSNNIFNDMDVDYFNGVSVISPELSFSELKEFVNKNFAVLVHGKVVMMNTKYLDLPARLKDEKGYVFRVRRENSCFQILNSIDLGLGELVLKLKEIGVQKYFLDLDHGVDKYLRIYSKILTGKKVEFHKFNFTKGHWDKGVS